MPTSASSGCLPVCRYGDRSPDHLDLYVEVIGPGLPDAVSGVGRAGQAASESQADAVGQAQARTVPVERGGEAGVEAAEGSDGDAEVIEGGIDSLCWKAEASGLLENLGVVDSADGGVVAGCSLSNQVSAGFVVDECQAGGRVEDDHSLLVKSPSSAAASRRRSAISSSLRLTRSPPASLNSRRIRSRAARRRGSNPRRGSSSTVPLSLMITTVAATP